MIQSLRNQLAELETAGKVHQPEPEGYYTSELQITTGIGDPQVSNATVPISGELINSKDAGKGISRSPPFAAISPPDSNIVDELSLECTEGNASPHSPLLYQLAGLHHASPSECLGVNSFEKLMKPINQMINKKSHCAEFSAGSHAEDLTLSNPSLAEATLDCKCDNVFETNTRQWCLPLRRRADALVGLFFARNNSVFPILHEQTFRSQYTRIWEAAPKHSAPLAVCSGLCKQKSQGQLFPATLYAMFAVVSLFESAQLEQNATRADRFFREAQKIDILETLDNEVGIELVQLLLLMARYLQSTERFSKCKNISGLAIRLAQNMGLHYSGTEARTRGLISASSTQLECEMRTRVWQGCVMLERYADPTCACQITFTTPFIVTESSTIT